jgi:hypothetical protein
MTPKQKGLLGAAVGGIFGGLSGSGDTQGSQGYTGGIPDLTATRTLVPGVFDSTYTTPTGELAPRRPGSSGRRYFTDVEYAPVTDAAGLPTIMGAAEFQAANQAALDKQQELTDLGLGILGTYEQNLADQQAATTPAVTTPAVTTPAVTAPAVTTPAATTPAATTPAATTPAATTDTTTTDTAGGIPISAATTPAEPTTTAYDSDRSLTEAELKQAVLDGTMSYGDAYRQLGIADAYNPFGFTEAEQMALGIHESQRTGQGYKQNPATGAMALYDYDTNTFVDDIVNTTTTDTTDSNAAFNTFISPFYNSELTPAQLIALGNSGYDLSTIASTLKVDATALSSAIAQATSAAQTQSVFDAVDPADGFSDTEAASVAKLILDGKTGITDVANQFEDVSDMDVIEGMLRGGYESPAAMTERLAPYNTGLTDETQLMASLLSQKRTTPEELAVYYGSNPDYPEYAGITAADVRGFAKDLGIEGYAQGGDINGYYLGGTTDGMADQIPATIDNMQPAALSDGEFVIPADVVSHLGNGNSDAGAKNLYSMMDRVRTDRTGTPNQGRQIDPNKYLA